MYDNLTIKCDISSGNVSLLIMLIILIVFSGMLYNFFQGRKKQCPVYGKNFAIFAVALFCYFIFNLFIVFDADGNRWLQRKLPPAARS